MKKTKETKRLTVNSEKVRPLTQDELTQAAGGMPRTSACLTAEGCHCDCSSYNC